MSAYYPKEWQFSGKLMARVNADASWTVDWEVIRAAANTLKADFKDEWHVSEMIAVANMLLAAKDNFVETSEAQSLVVAQKAYKVRNTP